MTPTRQAERTAFSANIHTNASIPEIMFGSMHDVYRRHAHDIGVE